MSLIALKFVAAGMIAVAVLFVSMAVGAGWKCFHTPKSARGGFRASRRGRTDE